MRKKKRKAKKKLKEEYMTMERLKAYMDFATQLKIAQEQRKNKNSNK